MGDFNRAVCSSAEEQSSSTRCLSSRKTQPRMEWGRTSRIVSWDAVVERKSKKTGYCPAGRGRRSVGRCFSKETAHSVRAKGDIVVAAAVAAAFAKERSGWTLDDEATAFSAIVPLVQKNFIDALMLVNYLIIIRLRGVNRQSV